MSTPTNKQQPPRQNKEVVTVKDVTTSKYDAMAASLESLTEVTVREAEASMGSIGEIEAMGDQIKASIEEMGKSVAENICGALAATIQEVLTQVLRNREPATITIMGMAPAAAATGQECGNATAGSKAKPPRGSAGADRVGSALRGGGGGGETVSRRC
ncbi:unnamed protein product [Linum trigynum]|uniref:Uncharacterized protein n=1 Tax=Linum trigynum TaxID=586398 RepID=A0AAV2CC60_9ROSI